MVDAVDGAAGVAPLLPLLDGALGAYWWLLLARLEESKEAPLQSSLRTPPELMSR